MDQDLVAKPSSPSRSLGDARRRAALLLLAATGIALVPSVLIFLAVLHGEWMTGAFGAVADLLFKQPAWAVLAATSPLAAALLVGYGYMQRGMRKRAAEREAATRQASGDGNR